MLAREKYEGTIHTSVREIDCGCYYVRMYRSVRTLTIGATATACLLMFAATASAAPSVCPFTWGHDLKVGSTGADVLALQKFLNSDAATQIAASGTGSPGMESTNFGAKTKASVIKFQEKYFNEILAPNGLKKGTGSVGPSTRATLNSLCAVQVSASVPASPASQVASAASSVTTEDALTISMPAQPAPTLAVENALYVPFTNITLTAGSKDVEVKSVTITRTGFSKDKAFADAELMDEDGGVISTAYFRSNHHATFIDSFTVPAGTSKTVTLAGDMASDLTNYAGQQAFLRLDAVEASSPVVGTLPVQGTGQWTNDTLVIGSASAVLSSEDPREARNVNIQDTGVRFAGVRVTAGSQEDVRLDSITWEQTGTIDASDIANVATVVDGTSYPAEVDGRWYTSSFPGGITIQKGNSLELVAKGDITTSGSNRTVKFDIHWPSDVYLYGLSYGYGIYLLPGGNTATEGNSVFLTDTGDTDGSSLLAFFSGSTFSIFGATANGVYNN